MPEIKMIPGLTDVMNRALHFVEWYRRGVFRGLIETDSVHVAHKPGDDWSLQQDLAAYIEEVERQGIG